ncbi:sugar-transfer associated ATP-grasp domain-containing protein [Salibacter halophilus]|uniref:sugar-transfer associated ATP-grasp domain-containing protein n=1 Tax=Salibacter halophilus TaxID=1803916 RepID=UPI001CB89919
MKFNVKNKFKLLVNNQRVSVNSPIDNLVAGNLVAPIDDKKGGIFGLGIYSDITRKPESTHPITGVKMIGFQVPMWKECLKLA